MNFQYLKSLLLGLSHQTLKPDEVVLVIKNIDSRDVEELCVLNGLEYVIVEQKQGFFTHALNLGKKNASGDLVIFTDDDAIPNPRWIETYLKLHQAYRNAGCISSRDKYWNPKDGSIKRTPDDAPYVKLYRWLVRSWMEDPHPLLKKYRFGVYLTKKLRIAHGPFIPSKACYSLPFRGVNMSFKRETLDALNFPEHPLLKRALGNEQYVGLQLILNGWESIYVPNNPVLHIMHQSLSRTSNNDISKEFKIMKAMYAKLINQQLAR